MLLVVVALLSFFGFANALDVTRLKSRVSELEKSNAELQVNAATLRHDVQELQHDMDTVAPRTLR